MKVRNFEDFAKTSSGRCGEKILLTHTIKPKHIYPVVLGAGTKALLRLVDGCKYSTEEICGPAIWASWSTAERRVAGMCMAYLVRNHVVVLYPHRTLKKGGKAFYCTQPMPEPVGRITTKFMRNRRTGEIYQLIR